MPLPETWVFQLTMVGYDNGRSLQRLRLLLRVTFDSWKLKFPSSNINFREWYLPRELVPDVTHVVVLH